MEPLIALVDSHMVPILPETVKGRLNSVLPLDWGKVKSQCEQSSNEHVRKAALSILKTAEDFHGGVTTPAELIVVVAMDGTMASVVFVFMSIMTKWLLFFLIGDVLFNLVRLGLSLAMSLLTIVEFLGPAYIGLVVLRSLEKEKVEDKTNVTTLLGQSWANRFLSLPPPSRKISTENAVTLGSLVMTFFILTPLLKFLGLFLPFFVPRCVLGMVIYHPYITQIPRMFRFVKAHPIFITISVLFELDVDHIQKVFDNVYLMREAEVLVPWFRFRSPFSVVSKLQRSGESEEWVGVNEKDATETKTVSLRIREVEVDWDQSKEVVVAVKQVPNGGRSANEKIESLVYSSRVRVEDRVGKCDVFMEIPVLANLDVTLKLEIRGKLTFGSDPVVDTIEINVAEMFVDTGVKVASDLELKGENGATMVVDVGCKEDIKYM